MELHGLLQLFTFLKLFTEQRFHEPGVWQLFDTQTGAIPVIKELLEIISFEFH
jgi:hypothetical protein